MARNSLADQIKVCFPKGLDIDPARELYKALFCSADWLPELDETLLTKRNLALAFSSLVGSGFIRLSPEVRYDISPDETSYWLDVIKRSLSGGEVYDRKIVKLLLRKYRK